MSLVSKPLVPKNPNGPLRVIILGRISTVYQNIENIDASYRFVEAHLQKIHKGPMEIRHLGEQASGMLTDRETIVEADNLIATGTWDLVITEDLSRFYRNPRYQYAFVQDAVDHDTRVICIGDSLDTADEQWETNLMVATVRHGLVIPDTRRRVRRTATNSFHTGGMVQKVKFGYRKLTVDEAKSGQFGPVGLRIAKVPECTSIIQRMKAMVLEGHTYAAVADWLNAENVRPGQYVKAGAWSRRHVREFLSDPILYGMRTFRKVMHQPIFRTGKHRRVRNPDVPESEIHPELAHLTPEEYVELMEEMNRRAREYSRPRKGASHPLHNRPRSRTLWPGQHMRCGICGDLFYWSSGGQLKCKNGFATGAQRCWNHVQVSAEQVRLQVIPWLLGELEQIPTVRQAIADAAWQEYERMMRISRTNGTTLDGQIRDLENQAKNLAKAIRTAGEIEALVNQLNEVNNALVKTRHQKCLEDARASESVKLVSRDDFDTRLDEGLLSLARRAYEFSDLMRRIIPEFLILPVQALDTGMIRPRAKITVNLSAYVDNTADTPASLGVTILSKTFDLFDSPVHIRHLPALLAEKKHEPKMTGDALAEKLRIHVMTVKRAFAYHRLMQREGTDELYRELRTEPVNTSRRWRQHVISPDGEAKAG